MKLQATIDFEIDYEIDVITPGPILSPEDILNAWQIRLDDFFLSVFIFRPGLDYFPCDTLYNQWIPPILVKDHTIHHSAGKQLSKMPLA